MSRSCNGRKCRKDRTIPLSSEEKKHPNSYYKRAKRFGPYDPAGKSLPLRCLCKSPASFVASSTSCSHRLGNANQHPRDGPPARLPVPAEQGRERGKGEEALKRLAVKWDASSSLPTENKLLPRNWFQTKLRSLLLRCDWRDGGLQQAACAAAERSSRSHLAPSPRPRENPPGPAAAGAARQPAASVLSVEIKTRKGHEGDEEPKPHFSPCPGTALRRVSERLGAGAAAGCAALEATCRHLAPKRVFGERPPPSAPNPQRQPRAERSALGSEEFPKQHVNSSFPSSSPVETLQLLTDNNALSQTGNERKA
ncbi:uncharacterized protein [Apteryx mantelli]|uniref:Uncharacterized protein n=1 Tax=Apteryx mantelli TaxID=2696672 RepID=A0ABM4ED87_9AVES